MKHLMIAVVVLAVPALAAADHHQAGEQGEMPGAQEEQQPAASDQQPGVESQAQQEPEVYGERAEAGTRKSLGITEQVQGKVASIDPERGELQVDRDGEMVTLHGTPRQLSAFKDGQDMSADVKRYGDATWLMDLPKEQQLQSGAEFSGDVVARVESVDPDKGELKLKSGEVPVLKGHPQTLETIQPGQLVSISYERIKDANWIQSVNEQREDKKAKEIQEEEKRAPATGEAPPAP